MQRLKLAVLLFLILSFSGFILNEGFAKQNNPNDLLDLFTHSGVQTHSIELTYGDSMGQYNKEELLVFKRKLERNFSIKMIAPKKPCCVQVAYQYLGEKKIGGNSLSLKLESVKNLSHDKRLQTYLIINFNLKKTSNENLTNSYFYLNNKLSKLGIKPKINTTIQGSLPKELTHKEQQQFLTGMFRKVNGKIVEGLDEKDVISLTGFTNKFSRAAKSNNQTINLEIASRYDPLSKKTILTIGNPIITENY